MATYLEQVQWKLRPANLIDNEALGPPLPVSEVAFTMQEVGKAIRQLKSGKAAGPDDIPAEYWKAISQTPGGLKWVTELCNTTWAAHKIPEAWRHATVSTIYNNKGPIHMCENYRPISLLCVAYKLLAGLLLQRLQQAGAEDRLIQTQCGFRRGRGTTDAVHAVRRHIELAHARKDGGTTFLALDWKKLLIP